ncbi:MAG: protein-L-isoaspartate O-methyltransferase family protein [Geminicoccales bacterium]
MAHRDAETKQFRVVRDFYAKFLAACSRSNDPRIEQAFQTVPRERFLPPGPWKVFVGNTKRDAYIETPSADPIHLYQNVLVALDEPKGVNNGQPSLHANWLGAVLPKPGENVVHIGAGRGYYSAILSSLVLPDGAVTAFEINKTLASAARNHLVDFENVTVVDKDAVVSGIPEADVIYVNAGVTGLPKTWLQALRLGGRLIFPWRPLERVGMALLITRKPRGFQVENVGFASFISCIGASDEEATIAAPDLDGIRQIRSVHLVSQEKPDDTAIAIYKDVWFSRAEVFDRKPS